MKKILRPYFAFAMMAALAVTTSACDDHGDEPHDHDQELITTLTMTMTPQGGGQPVTATFRDLDGDGGNAPVYTPSNVVLQANTLYNTTITVLDEANSEDLTAEIRDKGAEHEFFFVPTPANLVTVTKTDRDTNNRPIGLTNTIQTAGAGAGTLRVVLKHQPGNLKTNTSTIQTGETDIDVNFNMTIQ